MGWSGSLSGESAVGAGITFTPDISSEGGYAVSSFTAPKKGIYRFRLYGSGGTNGSTDADYTGANGSQTVKGGAGGYTEGYLLLEKGQVVYVGAGGTCSAAFVSSSTGSKLSAVAKANLYFVAGGGGAAGRACKRAEYARTAYMGGAGGGTSGAAGASGGGDWFASDEAGGGGGTQSAGGQAVSVSDAASGKAGSYGEGGAGVKATESSNYNFAWGGRGGDGYYGGASGHAVATHNSQTEYLQSHAWGGGGGSGYVKTASLTHIGRTYKSTTAQGSGMAANTSGKVIVTYYARALLPVFFDGVQLEKLFFNGTDVESLTYNGTLIYMRRGMRWLSGQMTRLARRARFWARHTRSLTASA